MPEDDKSAFFGDGGKRASQAWSNALKRLREAWLDAMGNELPVGIDFSPKVRFENGIREVVNYLRKHGDNPSKDKLLKELDVNANLIGVEEGEITKIVTGSFLGSVELDNRSPNDIKEVFYTTARVFVDSEQRAIELRVFLRTALDNLYPEPGVHRRPYVGANRHWPRLWQYLQECEEETDRLPNGKGFRIANLGRPGPVPHNPAGPDGMQIFLDERFF